VQSSSSIIHNCGLFSRVEGAEIMLFPLKENLRLRDNGDGESDGDNIDNDNYSKYDGHESEIGSDKDCDDSGGGETVIAMIVVEVRRGRLPSTDSHLHRHHRNPSGRVASGKRNPACQ
jgi:hypothetical protein